jgi:antitoxin component YwqK of YwqJK toxin-antitoxin module
MKYLANIKLTFIFLILLGLNASAQFKCDDIMYDGDTLAVISYKIDTEDILDEITDELFTGYCDAFDKKGKIVSRTFIAFGVLDSIVYFDKNGLIEAVEPYRKWIVHGTLKTYYRSGALKESINFKNDKHFGLWREYYENGNIKYEADYINDDTTKNDSYYTWTKKGVKYLHTIQTIHRERKIGKLQSVYSRTKHKKVKVKSTA